MYATCISDMYNSRRHHIQHYYNKKTTGTYNNNILSYTC